MTEFVIAVIMCESIYWVTLKRLLICAYYRYSLLTGIFTIVFVEQNRKKLVSKSLRLSNIVFHMTFARPNSHCCSLQFHIHFGLPFYFLQINIVVPATCSRVLEKLIVAQLINNSFSLKLVRNFLTVFIRAMPKSDLHH
jgi:hypothetical protein